MHTNRKGAPKIGLNQGTPRERFAVSGQFQNWGSAQSGTTYPLLSNGSQTSASFASTYTMITDTVGLRCLYINGTYSGGSSGIIYGLKDNNGNPTIAGDITLSQSYFIFDNPFWMGSWGPGPGGTYNVAAGAWLWTNPVGDICAAAESDVTIRTFVQVGSGKAWYYTRRQISSDGGTDAIMHGAAGTATGSDITYRDWTYNGAGPNASGGTSTSFSQFAPTAITGIQVTPVPIVSSRGDSVMNGYLTSDGVNFVQKAFSSATVAKWAANLGTTGILLRSAIQYDALSALLAPLSDYWFLQSNNDIYNGQTLAQAKANILQGAQQMSAGTTRRVVLLTGTPRTTSSDSFATATNQTPAAQESTRVALNAWIMDSTANGAVAQSGGNIWTAIDICAQIEVNSANSLTVGGGRWISNGVAQHFTTDGTHPYDSARDLMAATIPTSIFQLF